MRSPVRPRSRPPSNQRLTRPSGPTAVGRVGQLRSPSPSVRPNPNDIGACAGASCSVRKLVSCACPDQKCFSASGQSDVSRCVIRKRRKMLKPPIGSPSFRIGWRDLPRILLCEMWFPVAVENNKPVVRESINSLRSSASSGHRSTCLSPFLVLRYFWSSLPLAFWLDRRSSAVGRYLANVQSERLASAHRATAGKERVQKRQCP